MLTPDQRTELVATLTAKVKQFKIGVPLTTRAGAPAETKAEYDATTSPTVLVPLDYIAAELYNHPSADLDNKVHKLFQRLYNVEPERSEQLLRWLYTAEGMDALASASPDGDVEMKRQEEDEVEVDPLQCFLGNHPALSFFNDSSQPRSMEHWAASAHSTCSYCWTSSMIVGSYQTTLQCSAMPAGAYSGHT